MNTYILFCGRWSLFRRLEMMIFLVDIADDIVVDNSVLAWAEVPKLSKDQGFTEKDLYLLCLIGFSLG